jgi:hypothetical protein
LNSSFPKNKAIMFTGAVILIPLTAPITAYVIGQQL